MRGLTWRRPPPTAQSCSARAWNRWLSCVIIELMSAELLWAWQCAACRLHWVSVQQRSSAGRASVQLWRALPATGEGARREPRQLAGRGAGAQKRAAGVRAPRQLRAGAVMQGACHSPSCLSACWQDRDGCFGASRHDSGPDKVPPGMLHRYRTVPSEMADALMCHRVAALRRWSG